MPNWIGINLCQLARAVGYSRSMLGKIKRGKRRASFELALAIEKATNGAIQRWDLRPDIWGSHDYPPAA